MWRSPTILRREPGALLRVLRKDAGLTVEQVAGRLLCSLSKVSRLETGQQHERADYPGPLRDLRD
jgi:transcriptional regulator with XRE-family HTH domain